MVELKIMCKIVPEDLNHPKLLVPLHYQVECDEERRTWNFGDLQCALRFFMSFGVKEASFREGFPNSGETSFVNHFWTLCGPRTLLRSLRGPHFL